MYLKTDHWALRHQVLQYNNPEGIIYTIGVIALHFDY